MPPRPVDGRCMPRGAKGTAPGEVVTDRERITQRRVKWMLPPQVPGQKQVSNIQPIRRKKVDTLMPTTKLVLTRDKEGAPTLLNKKDQQNPAKKNAQGDSSLHLLSSGKHRSFQGIHKPIMLILGSAHLLETVCQLSATTVSPSWMPAAVGAGIGIGFTLLNRVGVRRYWRVPDEPLNIVITGSSRGIGKALARELLKRGDRVMVTSSNPSNVRQALKELRSEVGEQAVVHGIACNVSSPGAVQRLADAVISQMGVVDVWINNAGYSGRYQRFVDSSHEQIQSVVQTNLIGSLLCTKAALHLMKRQPHGGHIFNIDGAGADSLPTPFYTAYGATKAGIAHLMGSLNEEAADLDIPVGIHTLSPGMVLTPLLLEGATDRNKAIFNILCEQPETVAAFLAPRVRTIAARGGVGQYIRFLTVPRAIWRFIKSPFAANRFFSSEGEQLYLEERERILSPSLEKVRRRLARKLARQDHNLALAYSMSLAASFALLVASVHGFTPKALLPFT